MLQQNRCFRLLYTKDLPNYLDGHIGQIEDQLDDLSQHIATLAARMHEEEFSASEIAVFVRAAVSLKIIQEVERLDSRTQWSKQIYNDLIRQLSYVWSRPPSSIHLFEFSSSKIHCHFRGLLPWPDIKKYVMQRYAEKVSNYLTELSDSEIREQAMQWEFPPSQLWDAIFAHRDERSCS